MQFSALLLSLLLFMSGTLRAAEILLVRYDVVEMQVLGKQLRKQLPGHRLQELVLQEDTSYEQFAKGVQNTSPDILALLDNQSVAFAERYLKEYQGSKPLVATATMGLNLKALLQGKPQMCGIAYEVPPFTILTRFRSYSKKSIETVLAPYRKSEFGAFMQEAVAQLAKVQMRLVPVDLDPMGSDSEKINRELLNILQTQYKGQAIDAVLIPTDNVLINQKNLQSVWLKKAKELPVPFLCNVESWAAQRTRFCAFAAYPDIEDLGQQFADQILQIAESGLKPGELGVEYIVAAKDKLNREKLKDLNIDISEEF
jgi:hypothetical protein